MKKRKRIGSQNKSHDDKALQLSKKEWEFIDEGENNEVEIKKFLFHSHFEVECIWELFFFRSSSWLCVFEEWKELIENLIPQFSFFSVDFKGFE